MGKQGAVWGWISRIRHILRGQSYLHKRKMRKNRQKDTSDLHFYNHRARRYGFMSNFYQAKVLIDGKTWPTTEHYFQAMKFAGVDDALLERVRAADSPGKAAALGRSKKFRHRKDWNEGFVDKHGRFTRVKLEVMRKALRAKFDQHLDLKEKLLATGGRKLVERTKKDRYWGDGGD
eukprot:c3215_g2_i1 orf=1-525(-)